MSSAGNFDTKDSDYLSQSKILAVSGEFDIESVLFLNLANTGIDNIQTLELCTSLIRLDLRQNHLSTLNSLKNLKALTYLNLSANRITNIDSLGGLENLCELNLAGNLIGSFERLKCLRSLEHLQKLRLYDSIKQLSNPICHDLSYDDKMKVLLPKLTTLDGMRLKGFGSQLSKICTELDEQIKNLRIVEHDEFCPCDKCSDSVGDERTFGPVGEYPIPSAWLQPGYFSLPSHCDKEEYAITEFRETVDSCKKTNEAAKGQIDGLRK